MGNPNPKLLLLANKEQKVFAVSKLMNFPSINNKKNI